MAAIKANLTASYIDQSNSETEIADFILGVSVNNNQLIIDLADTSSGDFEQYANEAIRLEYDDTSTTNDPLKGASGAVMSGFEFSVYADEYYSEVVRTGATTINSNVDEGAETQGNELVLSFDGGSLHFEDILYNDLKNKLRIIDTTDSDNSTNEVAGAIHSIESISGSEIRVVLDHEAIADQGVTYGRELSIEYDGSTNVLRSIDGIFTDSFSNVRFTYEPTLGFDDVDVNTTSKAVDLVFSGGLLDVPTGTDLDTLETNVENHLSVYKFDDATGNYSEITNAISDIAIIAGTDQSADNKVSDNSKVTLTLDMTVLQSAGVKHSDQLRIEYDPNNETNGLKSKAATLSGTSIGSETIGKFDTTFDVDMEHMPQINAANYDGEDLVLSFTGGNLKLAAAENQAALFTSIKSKLKIATESGFTENSVITDAIKSVKAMTTNSITL